MEKTTSGEVERSDTDLRFLAVGEDPSAFKEIARWAEGEGVAFERVRDSGSALHVLSKGNWSAVLPLLDDRPDEELRWWVEILSRMSRRPRLVVLVPNPHISFALHATQLGVMEVLSLPVDRERFNDLLRRMRTAADETTLPLPNVRSVAVGPHQMVSESPAMLPVFRTIAQVAPTSTTVLITGESGTGKELVARAIHLQGPRAKGPFVAINCAAIPENLLESELFGHELGAFTGAVARKIGRFERACGGTLVLDEIGDMSLALQSKMLRAIEEREIERVGGTDTIPVDVRLIAATNRDIGKLVEEGQFREDLYYRLAVVTIRLPRLRERGDDLLMLTAAFLEEFGQRYGKQFTGITDTALGLLRRHDWVGNVRELRNVMERAVILADDDTLRAEHLPEEWRTSDGQGMFAAERPLLSLQEVEARHIAKVLDHTGRQITEAADILGIHRNTLSRKIKEYGL